tara:strand:+ start:98 stop:394 length:297 start_codon:yes stop_codon:yes gene_type:complete
MVKVVISKSKNKSKKWVAVFYEKGIKGALKTVNFGSSGYEDYTTHGDETRKKNYLLRHKKNEDWNDFMTAGSLSRWILWNKKTLKSSIADYKKKFNLS